MLHNRGGQGGSHTLESDKKLHIETQTVRIKDLEAQIALATKGSANRYNRYCVVCLNLSAI